MKPFIHAKNSVRRYGGVPDDYLPIHNWMDSTKSAYADTRHRAILHNTFGIFLAEQVFGVTITNSEGKAVSVRDVAEDHVAEDCAGKIPTLEDWLGSIELRGWMRGQGMQKYVKRKGLEYD